MSRWDKIPKMQIDVSEDWPMITKRATDAYYKCARFCSEEILRSETWRLLALTSCAINFLFISCMVFGR